MLVNKRIELILQVLHGKIAPTCGQSQEKIHALLSGSAAGKNCGRNINP